MTAGNMPQGWGLPNQTPTEIVDTEKRCFGQLANAMPEMVMRSEPKPVVNTKLLEGVKQQMRSDGFEDGFDFTYLEQAIFGKPLEYKPQLIGSCVASGGRIVDTGRMLAETFIFNESQDIMGSKFQGPESFQPFAPFNYRSGRKLGGINGGSASGRDDGSFCAPHYQGKIQDGFLPCSVVPSSHTDAWPEPQNHATYRKWGADDQYLNMYRDKVVGKLEETEKVSDINDLKTLLVDHLKPMQVCSLWAFESSNDIIDIGGQRTPIYRRSNQQWAHNMSIVGCVASDGKWFVKIQNTWGKMHSGNDWFLIPIDLMARWCRDAEIQTTGNILLFEKPEVISA